MASHLLEVPSQFVDHLERKGREQLVPDDFLGSLTDPGKMRRHNDPQGPCRQLPDQDRVTLEEETELVQPRVGNDVNEHAAPGWMDPNRKPFREVARGPSFTLSGGDVGQHQLVNTGQRLEVRGLLFSRRQPQAHRRLPG